MLKIASSSDGQVSARGETGKRLVVFGVGFYGSVEL